MSAVKGQKLEVIKCPLCEQFSSKRLTSFEKHIVEEHKITVKYLWDKLNDGPILCGCGCKKETPWHGWKSGYGKFIIGHNANIYTSYDAETAKKISDDRKAALRGKTSWAKGLTKQNDERVAARAIATSVGRKKAFEEGKIVAWSKGLDKDTDKRVEKAADSLRKKFKEGELVPWAKGLTKENDERIEKMSLKVSMTLRQDNIRQHLDSIKRLSVNEIQERIENNSNLEVIDGTQAYINDAHKIIKVRCRSCGTEFTESLRKLQRGRCYTCAPGGSAAQEEIARYVESLGVRLSRNDRSALQGQELDVYVPEHNLAIEYNGLYWHSQLHKSTTYHQNKTDACKKLGITLLHVFEDEWRDKRHIVESMIRSRLGLNKQNTVAGRKLKIIEMSTKQRKEFFNTNHMDGDVNAGTSFGLQDESGQIVYGLSLRTPFHKRNAGMFEVGRCCPATNMNVQGGLSKLVKRAVEHAKKAEKKGLLTYVDYRLGGEGKGYEIAGFKLKSRSGSRFWWTDYDVRFNRFKYKADKSRGMTEAQVADEAQVVRIFGCGNAVYEMLF